MILPPFAYARPKTVKKAIALYQGAKGQAVYLAGGTDLVPRIKQRLMCPALSIDLKGIQALKRVTLTRDWLKIGANVTLYDLKNHPVVAKYYPALYESLNTTSCETLQMRGTLGGNVLQDARCLFFNKSDTWRKARGFCLKMGGESCNAVKGARVCFANYASDNAPVLLTLGAEVLLSGIAGDRQIPLLEIFTGKSDSPFTLHNGEILTQILIPAQITKGGYLKLRVRDSIDYPLVGVALSTADGRGRLAVGGIGGKPLLFEFRGDDRGWVERIADEALNQSKPVRNTVLSAAYRKRMVKTLTKRIIKLVMGEDRR
ncbi:MAG: 4-hydroxybenzoyl-CoA reductase subunit beta [Syntrophorhabdus sp. PtaB.Bin006]|nr:MAG: 4-hydroxybenzoyl-CoA reductase subunit beta [Syntrophorhabdus sp. PtaB.Bin006]